MTYAPRIRITSQPRAFSGALNETITMSVVAEGNGLSYRWQWREPGTAWTNSPVAGNQTSTISMPLTDYRNGLEYCCVITDSAGNRVVTDTAQAQESPIPILTQPQDLTGSILEQHTMTVAAEGSGFTYQWQWRTNSDCEWANSPLPGNQTASITIPFTLDRIGNQYRCIITDANGNSVASDYGEMRLADNNWTFTYDANGMRTSRTNGVTTYGYIYNGDKLSKMSVPYHTMEFTYDANGNPFSLIYNNKTYYYVTNLQGDVVSIVNVSGTKVVNYTYDAWGKVLTITGPLALSIGHLNPLRYRGYIYDPETRLYYLQSRYYDPEMGRFLNADAFASTGQGVLSSNMFAYCLNNPVKSSDSSGTAAIDSTHSFAYGGRGTKTHQGKHIIQKILEHVTTVNEDNITFSAGVTFGASGYGQAVGGTAAAAVDSSYNYAGVGSWNYGVGSSLGVAAMGGINIQVTNADVVTDLGGVSKSFGFSAALGVGLAVDIVEFIPASNPNTTNWGVSVTIGFGIGFDIHASQSNSTVSETWNPLKDLSNWLFGG